VFKSQKKSNTSRKLQNTMSSHEQKSAARIYKTFGARQISVLDEISIICEKAAIAIGRKNSSFTL